MKTVIVTSSSSSGDRSETRDYFPGCRKDANCTCDICQASINATLDLVPSTTRSKIPNPNRKPLLNTPIRFNSDKTSTPKLRKPKNIESLSSPPLDSTARVSFRDKEKNEKTEKRSLGLKGFLIKVILVVGLVLGMELGFYFGVSWVLRPELSAEMVSDLSWRTRVTDDLSEKLGFFEIDLQSLVRGEVSDCGLDRSLWKINQGDMLLNSQCILYKSAVEEVSIWGWPLQTSGLLTAEFSSRSLTVLSGRVTELSYGNISSLTMKANQSWVQRRWSALVVQLDKNTWIVEYKQARMLENRRLILAAFEFLSFGFSREISKIKHEFWFLPDLAYLFGGHKEESFKVPT